MINTSSEYQDYIINHREFLSRIIITLTDNTEIEIDADSIMDGGIVINDSTSNDGELTVGSANMGTCDVTLENYNSIFNDIDFRGATMVVNIGLQLSDRVEYLQKGVYTIEKANRKGIEIVLNGVDNMYKFDVPFDTSFFTFPMTIGTAINRLCTYCGVMLATPTFYNSNLTVNLPLNTDSMSCRDILAHLTQLTGCFARINRFGQLEIKWYDLDILKNEIMYNGGVFDNGEPNYTTGVNVDGGTFDDGSPLYTSGDSIDGGNFDNFNNFHNFMHIYSLDVENDDVEITGIKITYVETELDEDGKEQDVKKSVMYGTDDYMLEFSNNVFIYKTSFAEQIATTVGSKLIGMKFRPLNVSIMSDPSVECGDVAFTNDIDGSSYLTIVSNMKYSIGGEHDISSDAETPMEVSLSESSPTTKIIERLKENIINEKNTREIAIEELNRAIENSNGLYTTTQSDGSGGTIYLLHDKPLLADSMIIWRMSSEVFSVSTDGGATWNFGLEADGDVIAQRLYALGIDATYITTGKITSPNGRAEIDLDTGTFTFKGDNGVTLIGADGVANSDNFQATDNVANSYPLRMPFYIDDAVSVIKSVKLNWTQDKFRTYSTGTSSGGGSYESTSTSSGDLTSTNSGGGEYMNVGVSSAGTTESASGSGSHTHTVIVNGNAVFSIPSHTHSYYLHAHSHTVNVPSHSHSVSFGILEQNISNNNIEIYVDGVLHSTQTTVNGIVDLTTRVTTSGWHTIEIRSTTLKRISAQVNVKSYIRM